ncbi:hypothetical protein BC826DRAFT_1178107 [Russula brevipes]|nr:hypothetical protein BC826DRAFT_1178107 [Russula brevipes]
MKAKLLARILRVQSRRICGASVTSLLDSEAYSKLLGPKLVVQLQCTVEAMCKANWPAQQRSTEAERILKRAGLDEDWVKCCPPFFTSVTGNLNGMCGARSAVGRWKKKDKAKGKGRGRA